MIVAPDTLGIFSLYYVLQNLSPSFNSFGDRGKRLKLQQFLAKKADALYDKSNLEKTVEPTKQELGDEGKGSLDSIFYFHPTALTKECPITTKYLCRFRILCNNARP